MRRADAKHAVVVRCGVGHRRRRHEGVAAQVAIRQRQVGRNRSAAGGGESITDRVHAPAEGPHGPGDRLDRRPVGLDAKVGTTQGEGCLEFRAADRPAVAARADVDPIVESPARVVDPPFDELTAKPRQQCLADFSTPVAIAIGQEQDVRSTHHHQAILKRQQAIARRQPIGPHLGLVHPAIAVGIEQQLDRAVLAPPGLFGDATPNTFPANPANRAVDLARLVQFRHIDFALEIEAVDLADEHPALRVKRH